MKTWHFGACFGKGTNEGQRWALIILNQPLPFELDEFTRIWDRATWRIVADGGANILYDTLGPKVRDNFIPDHIRGDMDSARPEVIKYYAGKGCMVSRVEDQNSTDFQKCLALVKELEGRAVSVTAANVSSAMRPCHVVAMGALSGRLDHIFHSLHVLAVTETYRDIFLISTDSVAFLLHRGNNVIWVDPRWEGPTCGIAPVGLDGATITTKGLKWDLDNTQTKFGGLLSTSNAVVGVPMDEDFGRDGGTIPPGHDDALRRVYVETDTPVVWTISLHKEDTEEEVKEKV